MAHRLSRRGLLAGSAVALLTSALEGCGGAPLTTPTAASTSMPPDGTALATWELSGGFVGTAVLALRPPRLVVFGDGEAIADATYRSRLSAEELQTLDSALVSDLRAATTRSPAVRVADAPVTKVSVWSPTGVLSFTAEALDELRTEQAYPDVFYDARDRLAAVHKSVSATAQPYLADRVRLVAMPAESEVTDGTTWPADVVLPAAGNDGLRRADLSGDPARAVVRSITRDLDQRGSWPPYRLATGELVRASWRYLLLNE